MRTAPRPGLATIDAKRTHSTESSNARIKTGQAAIENRLPAFPNVRARDDDTAAFSVEVAGGLGTQSSNDLGTTVSIEVHGREIDLHIRCGGLWGELHNDRTLWSIFVCFREQHGPGIACFGRLQGRARLR